MDISSFLNAIALALSLVALAISARLAKKQTQVMKNANLLPVVIEMLREVRGPEFRPHLDYVQYRLASEYPARLGYSGLPHEAQEHVLATTNLFDQLGLLVAHHVIDEKLVIGYAGSVLDQTWSSLEPFTLEERSLRKRQFLVYFEHLVCRTRTLSPAKVNASLGLQRVIPMSPKKAMTESEL
jgi:hypothetical protein